jgi:hypothetical protein
MIVDRRADIAGNQLILQTESMYPDLADGCAVQVSRHQQEAAACSVEALEFRTDKIKNPAVYMVGGDFPPDSRVLAGPSYPVPV